MSSATPEFTASVSINVNQDKHTCSHCKRTFRSNRGLNQHLRSYASKTLPQMNLDQKVKEIKTLKHHQIQRILHFRVRHKDPSTRGKTIRPMYLRQRYQLFTTELFIGKQTYSYYHQERQENNLLIKQRN